MVKFIIIEDEESISDFLLSKILSLRPDWVNIKQLTSVKESVDWLKEEPEFDIAFVDIQLSDGISFEIFEQIAVKKTVVFTTAYDKYAIKAFEVNSIDYLLKPIKTDRLLKAIEKFESLNKKKNIKSLNYDNLLDIIQGGIINYRERFLVQSATAYYSIFSEQIVYFYIISKLLYAVTSDKKEHIIDFSMGTLEEEINPKMFFRANRSHIVNAKYIQKFENYFGGKLIIKLVPPFDNSISVSRLRAAEFKAWMGK